MSDNVFTLKASDQELGAGLVFQLDWALSQTGVSHRDVRVLVTLIMFADRFNLSCYPSQKKLAARAGMSEQSVSKSLQALQDAGLIRITRRGKKQSNYYEILCPFDVD